MHAVEHLERRTFLAVTADVQIGLNFTGTTSVENLRLNTVFPGFGIEPPDTMGGVGPSHIVEFINGNYAVYSRKNGKQLTHIPDRQFWINNGLQLDPNVNRLADPRIVYDHHSARWFAAEMDILNNETATNHLFLAVSKTSDPTRGWTAFSIQGDTLDGTRFVDMPRLGVDADGVYLATNNYIGTADHAKDVSVWSFPKKDLLARTPTIANRTVMEAQSLDDLGFTIQPAVDFGASDGRTAMVALDLGNSADLRRTNLLNTAGPGPATLNPVPALSMAIPAFSAPPDADQPGLPNSINVSRVGSRLSSGVFEQGDDLWVVHHVGEKIKNEEHVVVRWYKIDEPTSTVLQSGTISHPELDFYYPSVAANEFGDVVIGFSGSSETQFVSTYAAVGRTSGETTSFASPMLLKAGENTYSENGHNEKEDRWGDYSATVLDPTDHRMFWTFQEYAAQHETVTPPNFGSVFIDWNWAVQITQITLAAATANKAMASTLTATVAPTTFKGALAPTFSFTRISESSDLLATSDELLA